MSPAHSSGREFYRRRFESSVLGQHAMMPDEELKKYFKSSEEPAPFPSGPNTSFLDPTPMPRRFTADSLSSHNYRHTKAGGAKAQDPTYSTTTSEIGKLPLQAADFPIRWYGLRGEFTTAFFLGGKGPASKVNTSLNAAMDRSDFHSTFDQGWSGHLGLRDHNIPSLNAAYMMGRPPRRGFPLRCRFPTPPAKLS